MSPAQARIFIVAAIAFLLAAPATAHAAGSSKLGHPSMFVLTGRIDGPFQWDYSFQTSVAAWPPLSDVLFFDQTQKDASGVLEIEHVFDAQSPTAYNLGFAHADESGTYGTRSAMYQYLVAAPGYPDGYSGVFGYSQWAQTFRKDSSGAYCRFVITFASLLARSFAVDSARAELTLFATVDSHANRIDTFRENLGVRAYTPGGGPPTFTLPVFIGPMPAPTITYPGTGNHYIQMNTGTYTHFFDISGIAVGDTFSVNFYEVSQAATNAGELPGADASFRDPAGSSGIQIEVAGLTPLDDLRPPTTAVPVPPRAGTTALSPPWPNPSAGNVHLTLALGREGPVTVDVFDLTGRHVATLANGRLAPGAHVLTWRPTAAAAGVYFVRAVGPGFAATRRIVHVAP